MEGIFSDGQAQTIERSNIRYQDACGDILPFEFQAGGDTAKTAENDKGGTPFDQQRRPDETVVLDGAQQITEICSGGDAKGIIFQVYPGQRYRLKLR